MRRASFPEPSADWAGVRTVLLRPDGHVAGVHASLEDTAVLLCS
nr:hypothetical protein [Streptomyces spongiae]